MTDLKVKCKVITPDITTFTVRTLKSLVAMLTAVTSKPVKLMAVVLPEILVWILPSGILFVHMMDSVKMR